jgi:hypothetical protein
MKPLLAMLNVRLNQVRFCALLMCIVFPSMLRAQTFQPIPALSFTMTEGGANPLPQLVTPTSTGANFNYSATASTTTGGNWLSLSYLGCCGLPTTEAMQVIVNAPASLAAGTYTGKIVYVWDGNSAVTLTVPVTLVVEPATSAFLDNLPGQLSFSMLTAGNPPLSQSFQIRNAGTGTLSWTVATSYGSGSGWLSLSAASGTGTSTIAATVNPSALPGGGLVAGSYAAQLAVKTSGDETTIPVVVVVGGSTFRQVNPLNFVKPYGGANPLPQLVTFASTGTNFNMYATVVNSAGGDWLQLNPSYDGCCGLSTPQGITVGVNPAVDLPVGTYTGEVIVTSGGTPGLAFPVSLTIVPSETALFDDLPGSLNFSMGTGGSAPPGQSFQIRNAGTGTLAWTLGGGTTDGGKWLGVSATSGTAPSTLTVTVIPENLPGAGETPGAYTAQLILLTSSGRATIPISLVVGPSNFVQQNPLNFTMAYAGGNPLPQVLSIASTGANFNFNAYVVNSTGGNWLQISPSYDGCCGLSTPNAITASVNAPASLAAGTYTAEIVFDSTDGTRTMNVPVTLQVAPASATFFGDLPGQLDFSMTTEGETPPSQPIQIRNAGTGTLSWTATTSTADGGSWLILSSNSGTAPSTISADIAPAKLPGGGLVAGTYVGQIILKSSTDVVTIPVSVTVGGSAFKQVNGLNFTMTYGGANPLPQVFTLASTGTNFAFFASAVSSTGGNWLQISPSYDGCCGISTPYAMTASVNAAADLAPGVYSAEILVNASGGNVGIAVPVTLTVEAPTATFFDSLPGQVTFSMATGGTPPPAQAIQIRNAGSGTLDWTGSTSTSDGGSWLSLSATSGAAPSTITAKINPANLPGKGLSAGTFTGEIVLTTTGDTATIPVTVVVGANVFQQVNALNFTMTYGGNNPLPQVIPVVSTGVNFNFFASAASSTGGNWLQISPSYYGCCGIGTPEIITVSVAAPTGLAVGTYTSQVEIQSSDGTMTMVVPVTLSVEASGSTFFDDVPGLLGFSFKTGGTAPPSQTFQIRNAGAGTLDWTLATSTSDGGSWLSVSASSGTALSNVTVSVVAKNLPGAGLVAGVYTGQIVLQTSGDRVTIPVTVDLGENVFQQLTPLSFSKAYGGDNPSPQAIVVSSTGSNFSFFGLAASDRGGNWLQINPNYYGCCGDGTPTTITVSVNPAVTLAAGVYTGEILVTSNGGGLSTSIPVSLTVGGGIKAAEPAFAPPGGTYDAAQTVIITDSTPESSIFYTIDGSTPTTSSTAYSGPITVDSSLTINAIAVAPGYDQSLTGTAKYTITQPQPSTPAATETIAIAEATSGATVYYTTDGTTPTAKSKVYTGPITMSVSSTLKFIAIQTNHPPSQVETVTTAIQTTNQ